MLKNCFSSKFLQLLEKINLKKYAFELQDNHLGKYVLLILCDITFF